MSSPARANETRSQQGCEKQRGNSQPSEEDGCGEPVDVFDLFRPCLWTLRCAGVWLPGELKTTPRVRESLRGGPRAILYFLYCLTVVMSLLVHVIRLVPFAATLHIKDKKLIMAIVVIWIFLSGFSIHMRSHQMRKPLIEFARAMNEYYRIYGKRRYVLTLLKESRRSMVTKIVIIICGYLAYFIFFFVLFPSLNWITYPVDENVPKVIRIIWIIFTGFPWLHGGLVGMSTGQVMYYLSTMLRNEFTEFNLAMKNLAEDLQNEDKKACHEGSKMPTWNPDISSTKRGAGVYAQVAPAPADKRPSAESLISASPPGSTRDVSGKVDDHRYRFEELADLVDKVNAVLMYEISDVYVVFIPFVCLIVKGFVMTADTLEYVVFMILCGLATFANAVAYTYEAIKLNLRAHASSQYLLKPRFKHLSEKTIQVINIFVARLNGPPVGFTIFGLITIDISSTLTLMGTLIAYIFVVAEMDASSPTCPGACMPLHNASSVGANCTTALP